MLQDLRIKNFKSWKDTNNIQLARLTGLLGFNSSGKTSILQLYHLKNEPLEWSFAWRLPQKLGVPDPEESQRILFQDITLGFEAEISEISSGQVIADTFNYIFDNYRFGLERNSDSKL